MITPEFLQACTDEQINMGVAWLEAKAGKPLKMYCGEVNIVVLNQLLFPFNPCTSPNDAWPIMMANNIRVFPRPKEPFAKARTCALPVYVDAKCGNEGLLRAAMEVYLLMSNDK